MAEQKSESDLSLVTEVGRLRNLDSPSRVDAQPFAVGTTAQTGRVLSSSRHANVTDRLP